MYPEVSVHTAMWGGPWTSPSVTSPSVTGWASAGELPSLRNHPHLAAVATAEIHEAPGQRGRLRNLCVALRALLAPGLRG